MKTKNDDLWEILVPTIGIVFSGTREDRAVRQYALLSTFSNRRSSKLFKKRILLLKNGKIIWPLRSVD